MTGTLSNVLGLPYADGLTPTGYELPAEMSADSWLDVGRALGRVRGSVKWWLGDWWAYGEHRYGERAALVESDEWEGPTYQACKDAAMVCRAFDVSRRRDLSFTAHREVVPLPAEWQDKVLSWAEDRCASTRQIRDEVKRTRAFLAQGWTSDQLGRKALAESGQCVVANMSDAGDGQRVDEPLITWAEANDRFVRVDIKYDWGNPFEAPGDGDHDKVCDLYATHYFPRKRSLLRKAPTLRGKVAGCWCHPKRCHGHFIAEYVNQRDGGDR